MKPSKWTLVLAALVAGSLLSGSALAHHHGRAHVSFGFYVGGPGYWGYPYYYYPPYPYPYYYPAPVVVQQPAPVYTERQDVAPANEQGYWYYCTASRGYYPYVKECPGGWQKVPPTPQN